MERSYVTLYLIRHGRQSSRLCNVDVELSAAGFRQAALVGERLVRERIQAVYSSALIRAEQTAQAANLYWNVEHIIEPDLREIDFGRMEGLRDQEIRQRFGDLKREQQKMETDIPYPDGERAGDVIERVMPVLRRIAHGAEERVAVVTHGGVIRCAAAHILGMEPAKYRLLGRDLENCSITELRFDRGEERFTLERFNDYGHLEKEPDLLRDRWIQGEEEGAGCPDQEETLERV